MQVRSLRLRTLVHGARPRPNLPRACFRRYSELPTTSATQEQPVNKPFNWAEYKATKKNANPHVDIFRKAMLACRDASDFKGALSVWEDMKVAGVTPTPYCFNTLLYSCNKLRDEKVAVEMLEGYQKGWIKKPLQPSTCSMLISLFTPNFPEKIVEVIQIMESQKIYVDEALYISVLVACQRCPQLSHLGEKFYEKLKKDEIFNQSPNVYGVVLSFFRSFGLEKLKSIYSEFSPEIKTNPKILAGMVAQINFFNNEEVVWDFYENVIKKSGNRWAQSMLLWSTLTRTCTISGNTKKGLELFLEMEKRKIIPTEEILVSLVQLCMICNDLESGQIISNFLTKSLAKSNANETTTIPLFKYYAKFGFVKEAQNFFKEIPNDKKTASIWMLMINCCLKVEDVTSALKYFEKMKAAGFETNSITWISLIEACTASKKFKEANKLHKEIVDKNFPMYPEITSAIIDNYTKQGDMESASKVLSQFPPKFHKLSTYRSVFSEWCKQKNLTEVYNLVMFLKKSDVQIPDIEIWIILFKFCGDVAAGYCAKKFYEIWESTKQALDIPLANTILDMYVRCGCIEEAETFFVGNRKVFDITGWNLMIDGFGKYGFFMKANRIFGKLNRISTFKPTPETFSAITNACAPWSARLTLSYMKESRYDAVCVAWTNACAGKVEEAEKIYLTELKSVGLNMWKKLLGACAVHNNVTCAERVANRALEIDPKDSSVYILLAKIYEKLGKTEESQQIIQRMKEQKITENLGECSIAVGKTIYTFGDGSTNPDYKKIVDYLGQMIVQAETKGYSSDSHFYYKENLNQTQRAYHSDKLAVAYGLFRTPSAESSIVVVNKFPISGDSHSALKILSTETKRKIIVRDPLNFHVFFGGTCLCGDFFC